MKRKFGSKKQGDTKGKSDVDSEKPKMPVRGKQRSNAEVSIELEIPVQQESDIINGKTQVDKPSNDKLVEQTQSKNVNTDYKNVSNTISTQRMKNQKVEIQFEIQNDEDNFENKVFVIDQKKSKILMNIEKEHANKQMFNSFDSKRCQSYIYKYCVRQDYDIIEKLYTKESIIEQFSQVNKQIEVN